MKKISYRKRIILSLVMLFHIAILGHAQKKAVFIIVDGVSADAIEKIETPALREIAKEGGYTRAYLGGEKNGYSQSPTISAVGYNHLLTGTWSNKHNVWDNDIAAPNYSYWNIFRIAKTVRPTLKTAIFSSWTDNRTKLAGDGLANAGNLKIDYAFDGYELDTITFPPKNDRLFMFNIDEHVSKEAARVIEEKGPDLSWVYLEFTDDMGHMYGDSPQYSDAIRKADVQVGRIWSAIKAREKKFNEEWMIVVTTDHGRDASTGKDHGGQTDRERTTWITTNAPNLNTHFKRLPATTDIMPTIMKFMEIEIPASVQEEIDGVPFIGKVSVANLKAKRNSNKITLSWDVIDPQGDADIFITSTNNFKTGGKDVYEKIGTAKVKDGKFNFTIKDNQPFLKIILKAPGNMTNTWSVANQN